MNTAYVPKSNKFFIQQVVQDEDDVAYTVIGIAEYLDDETEYFCQGVEDEEDVYWLVESELHQFKG